MEIRGNIHFIGNTKQAKALEKPQILEKLQAAAETPVNEVVMRDKDNFVKSVSVRDFLADPAQFKAKGPAFLSLQVGSETVVIELKKLSKDGLIAALNTAMSKADKLQGEGLSANDITQSAHTVLAKIRKKEDTAVPVMDKLVSNPIYDKLSPDRQMMLMKVFNDSGLTDQAIDLVAKLAPNKQLSAAFFESLGSAQHDKLVTGRVLVLFRGLLDNANNGTLGQDAIKDILATSPAWSMSKTEFNNLEGLLHNQAKGPKGAKPSAELSRLVSDVGKRARREREMVTHLSDGLKMPPSTLSKVMGMVRSNNFGKEIFEAAMTCRSKGDLTRHLAVYEAVDKAFLGGKINHELAKKLVGLVIDDKTSKSLLKLLSHPDPAKLEDFVQHEHGKKPVIF